MFLMVITSCAQETVIIAEEEDQYKHKQKHCVLDDCPERWEAVIEDFCNAEADTNA